MASARSAAVAAPPKRSSPRRRAAPATPAAKPPKRRAAAKPPAQPRTASPSRARQRVRARGAILWIAVSGLLLGGVVFVNLAVLQLNLRLDRATQERTQLRAGNHSLQSQLSARLASQSIQSLAHKQYGLVEADPSTIGYLDLGR